MRINQITEEPIPGQNKDPKQIRAQIEELNNKLYQNMAQKAEIRKITKEIKYDDTVTDIVSRAVAIAEKSAVDRTELKYKIEEINDLKNRLESAIYGFEDLFEEVKLSINYEISVLQDELDFPDA